LINSYNPNETIISAYSFPDAGCNSHSAPCLLQQSRELSLKLLDGNYILTLKLDNGDSLYYHIESHGIEVVEWFMTENLNPPSEISDMSCINPGVAVFPWWGNFLANSYIDTLKMYIGLAAEMNWEWIEFGISLVGTPFFMSKEWKKTTWRPELTTLAKSKGINVYNRDEIKILENRDERGHVFGRSTCNSGILNIKMADNGGFAVL